MKVWWKLPVFGTALFLLTALLSGHLWTTALQRAAVCAAVLTLFGAAGAWVWRWMAEKSPSTIDLRSAPTEEDLGHLAVAPDREENRGPTPGTHEDADRAPREGRNVERPSNGGSRTGEWTDLAAWVQRQQ